MSEKEFKDNILPCSRKIYSVAFRILRSNEDAEDAVQETLMKMWKIRARLKEYYSAEALAVSMIKNYCLDILRKKKTESLEEKPGALNGWDLVPSPYDILRERETTAIIESVLQDMPDNYSDIIRRRDIEGQNYEDIAESLNQNINTVRVIVSRARKLLKEKFNNAIYEKSENRRVAGKVL